MKSSKFAGAAFVIWLLVGSVAHGEITRSVIVSNIPQRDGRLAVHERHTDQTGEIYDIHYLAEAGTDVTAAMTSRRTRIEAQIVEAEIQRHLANAEPGYVPVFVHITAAQMRQAVRERYRDLRGWEAVRFGAFINSLSLSDAQLTNLFGVSGGQLTTFKTKLSTAATRYSQVIGEVGQ